jgi:hypothetical protein
MPFLVTSASGANGDGFGALLTFELDGTLRGKFNDDRIVDPRGLAVNPNENLLFLPLGFVLSLVRLFRRSTSYALLLFRITSDYELNHLPWPASMRGLQPPRQFYELVTTAGGGVA